MLPFSQFFGVKTKEPIKSRVTDILWIPIFACVFIGYIVIAAIDMNDCVRHNGFSFTNRYDKNYIVALSASLGAGFLLSLVYMVIVHTLVKFLIVFTVLFHLCLSIALTVYYGIVQDYLTAFVSGLSALCGVLLLTFFYSKVDKAKKQWTRSVKIASKFPCTFLSAILLAIFCTGIAVLSGLIIFAGHTKLSANRSFDEYIILVIYITIGGYLMMCMGKAIVRSSVACVYGYWFYTDNGPSFPLFAGFKQAMTFSLGSLCAVCITLTLINICAHSLTFGVDILAQLDVKPDIIVVFWGASAFMSIFDWIFQIISLYTVIFISIYNCTYLEGTQRAVAFIGANLINEALTGGIFMIACRSVGTVAGFIAYVYLRANNNEQKLLVAFIDLAATQLCSIVLSPVIIGVQTLSVLEEETNLRESLNS